MLSVGFRLLVVLFLAGAVSAAPRNDAWRIIGPGGGGAQYHPTISPHDSNRVLISCDMTGAYISTDGGRLWRMFNLHETVRFFVFDPVDPQVIYAQTIGLWRSPDGGKTWRLVHPDPATVRGVIQAGDHADEQLDTPVRESVRALAVDPADSNTLYASFTSGGASTLRVSNDKGATWKPLRDLPGGGRAIYIDPKSPRGNRTVYVIGADSVLVREAGEWKQGPPSPGGVFTDVSAGFSASGKLTVWALGKSGLHHSADGGASWQALDPGVKGMEAVATSLKSPNVAYVSYGERPLGVAKTTDGGKTWARVWEELDRKSPDVDDGWLGVRYDPTWGGQPLALGVAPDNPEICYATDLGRTLRTTDGGKTWRASYTVKAGGDSFTSSGLDVTTAYGLHFDPFDRKRVFISYTDIGMFRSEDGGASWKAEQPAGVPRRWSNTTYWIEFDPEVKGRMWAVMSGTHDLPRPKMWRRTPPARFMGGVLRSEDGGLSWAPLTNGIPQTAATHVLLDPRSPAKARVLYVAGFGKGVYKSTDGGDTWSLKNSGLPGEEPFAWRLAMAQDGTLYVVLARRSEDGSHGNPKDGALYRSRDGAGSWEKVPLPEGLNGPNGLAIDPQDPARLYLAAWGRKTGSGNDVMGGIYLSRDAGKSWREVLGKDQHIYDITLDPRTPGVAYASGFGSSVWRSRDRGETWQRVRGYNFKWGHRVIPDPADPKMIYVTTFGGSIWHGPAAGDAKAVEDIVTPSVSYGK